MQTKFTYREYERRRLGSSASRMAAMVSMFRRSFGASSFAGFWRYWNPLFSYYLYYKCYRPLLRYVPRSLAVLLTFAVSGAVHDLFASLILARFYILFVPVFAFFGLLVIAEEKLAVSFSWTPFWLRTAIYTVFIVGSVLAGLNLF